MRKCRTEPGFCVRNDGHDGFCESREMVAERSAVNHPAHYGGEENPYECIKVIEAWSLDFCLGNACKYISRAGKKDPAKELEDLEKAAWYVARRIKQLKEK